ncbi:MAG: carbamoyl-phosphate synthase large subunit, partial [Bifidobacterium crudilactis]|nr:carbamoyl-phosphate synthase large subunit [Bifidobacterium crudilactis]
GVHTGDSITVAPVFTLTDREYQRMRDIGIKIIRGVGVDTGGCNIQFAVNPDTGRIIVIEMNPRVSRSSALASKATGFPIAKIATKLALGYTLDEIRNDITQSTPASFEPTIDYVVTKIPRFAFEKFPGADPTLTTSMKSVGEAMALAGNFQESLGKALRSIDKRHMNFTWDGQRPDRSEVEQLLVDMHTPTEHRYLQVQRAMWGGASIEEIFAATKIDRWFLRQIEMINQTAEEVRESGALGERLLRKAKKSGLSDVQIAQLRNLGDGGENTVRELRWNYGIRPVYKTVDTCAAEFDAVTPYYYSCYADESELRPREREAVIILGSGPNRIGQGIEFDYTCVHAVQELGKDYDTIMINCNPETVSTDYDMSDRLYFEPLTFEDVLEVFEAEKKMGPVKGVIVQLGGQTPLSLAARLKAAGVPILGTSPEAIDLAENRELFGEVLAKEHMNAPRYGTALSLDEAMESAHRIGYPVLVRPSYVLGGRGMEIVYDDAQLTTYVNRALDEAKADTIVSGRLASPLLIDKFLQDAVEIDVDALFDGEELYIGGIMEHVEEAGVHSGDAACTLPPCTLSEDQIRRLREGTLSIAQGCGVRGLINVQYAFMANTLYVIEANPRASRTVPFASKATGTA